MDTLLRQVSRQMALVADLTPLPFPLRQERWNDGTVRIPVLTRVHFAVDNGGDGGSGGSGGSGGGRFGRRPVGANWSPATG